MAGQVVTRASMAALEQDEYAHPSSRARRGKKGRKGKKKRRHQRELPTSIDTRPSPIARAMLRGVR